MKKERVRINLDVSKEIADALKTEANEKDMTLNAFIRLIIMEYLENHLNKERK